jgi:hypothetical protein
MWLFTQYGFFSVVCARDLTGKTKGVDPNTFMVRARSCQHLESLQSRCTELRGFEIAETKDTDYRYRLVVPKTVWEQVASELTAEIDYGNFKSRAYEKSGDKHYVNALHDVWEVMHRLQH